MDVVDQYDELTKKIKDILPLKAFPVREIISVFKEKGYPITLKSELKITSVHNSGDISGIMCVVQNNKENVIACSLTHLIFSNKDPLFKEISEYQRKRVKRIKKLNRLGLN